MNDRTGGKYEDETVVRRCPGLVYMRRRQLEPWQSYGSEPANDAPPDQRCRNEHLDSRLMKKVTLPAW